MTYFNCKEDIDLEDLKVLQPALWILITRSMLYCAEFNLPFKITSLVSDRKGIKSKSMTHETGRAADISSKGWTETHIYRFTYLMNNWYKDIGAISSSDLKPRAVVHHDAGYGSHFHLQVRPNADFNKFVKE